MKKHLLILIPLLFLLFSLPLLAQANVENNSWMVPQANNVFAIENDNRKEANSSYIFQLGSSMTGKTCTMYVTQQDGFGNVVNNGSSDTFYLIKKDNETQRKAFKLYYKLYTVSKRFAYNPSQNNPGFSLYSAPITLKKRESSDIIYSLNFVEFFIDFQGEGYDSQNLSPGEYKADLEVHYQSRDNDNEKTILTLTAGYLNDVAGGDTQLQYSFTVHPTGDSYFIELKPQNTQTTQISTVSFLNAKVSGSQVTYPQNPYKVVISPFNDFNRTVTSSDYFFKKMGTDGQPETIYNSLPYSVSAHPTTGSQGSSGDAKVVINAAHTKNNQGLTAGMFWSTNQYLNEFRLEANVNITIDPRYSENLSSGVYKSTLYYFVVAEE